MGLQGFERRLERLVEGTFTKAFRSGLQPIEIARKLLRELDAGRSVGVRGTVAPNHFAVVMSPGDAERFESFAEVLERELAEEIREHARDEGYHFVGPVEVEMLADSALRRGDLLIEAAIREGEGGRVGRLLVSKNRSVELTDRTAVIGRLPECDVRVEDTQVSRRHAEVRPDADGYVLVDLGSLNGTLVNGMPVTEHLLVDGDEIKLGAAIIRFEAS
jgi:Protein of unknown function (DUF3662)/FHA domain